MGNEKTTQEGVTDRITREAKQFAFYNYCSAAHNPDAKFDNIETWPPYAKVAFCAISNYMSGNPSNWPFTDRTTIPMDFKNLAFEAALQQFKDGKGKDEPKTTEAFNPDKTIICAECNTRPAVIDYNGHGFYVCKSCDDSLNKEFDKEYQ